MSSVLLLPNLWHHHTKTFVFEFLQKKEEFVYPNEPGKEFQFRNFK